MSSGKVVANLGLLCHVKVKPTDGTIMLTLGEAYGVVGLSMQISYLICESNF